MAELIGRSNGSMSMGTTNSTGGVTTTTTSASTSSSGAGATASASENASSASAAASASSTMTMTETRTTTEEVLRLTLQDRPGVTWDQDVIDNEGMGRKSSKRCCIFHKPRPFGESSTDTSDYDSDNNDSSDNNNRKIAHKKNPGTKKTPDHLRFHA